MAGPYSVAVAKHATIPAATAEVVTLGSDFNSAEVVNWGTANRIYFTVDGSVPTVGGDNTYSAGPNGGAMRVDVPTNGPTVVKLICTTANDYSVTGI